MNSTNSIPEIPVVYYHSIGPINQKWNRSFLTLDLPYFEDQLRFFKKHFNPIFLREYWNIQNKHQAAQGNPIVITLDDGFLDNWIWAYPLLKKFGIKATIFVSPEFVDLRNPVRPNLDDYWGKHASLEELNQWGYLNWTEMKLMLESGLIDIQSHTMSHTKYAVTDKLRGFHHPGCDCLYPVGNLFPQYKPYHILNDKFEKLVPYGYPLFVEESSVCARRVTIRKSFADEVVDTLKDYNFEDYSFERAFERIRPLYEKLKSRDQLIESIESKEDQFKRLGYEIAGSRQCLEENLKKPIEFLCWPHGDNNDTVHQMAIQSGYLATTSGSKLDTGHQPDRIPGRIGMHQVWNSRVVSLLKVRYKLGSATRKFPFRQINTGYNLVRYGKATI